VYGDRDPRSVTPESLLALRAKVAGRVSLTEAHRVIKIWRALWKKMAAMGYCQRDSDPSLIFSNTAPDPRQHVWQYREVLRLVRCAWRLGYKGLAAALSAREYQPGRALCPTLPPSGQRARDAKGAVFFLDRAKTGRSSRRNTLTLGRKQFLPRTSNRLVSTSTIPHPSSAPRGSAPGPRRGRRWLPRPYSTSKLDRDFRVVRAALFGDYEQRQIADMRRSGAVEADAGVHPVLICPIRWRTRSARLIDCERPIRP
jgi:hypothetical protein